MDDSDRHLLLLVAAVGPLQIKGQHVFGRLACLVSCIL